MIGYALRCKIHATDNDHFKLAELRVYKNEIPMLITCIRALIDGKQENFLLTDETQKAAIYAAEDAYGLPSFMIRFSSSTGRFYFPEEQLLEWEHFLLEHYFGLCKPKQSCTIQLMDTDAVTPLDMFCFVIE